MSCKVNLIWQSEALYERDWIRFLLSDFDVKEVNDLKYHTALNRSIIVMSGLRTTPSAYIEAIARLERCILYHISDESYEGGYDSYGVFDFVFRNYWSQAFVADRVKVLPLGYTSGTRVGNSVPAASERVYIWCFIGELKSSRPEMLNALSSIDSSFIHITGGLSIAQKTLSKNDYENALTNSVFCPCPMGNTNLETVRVYEALEAGCIPIVETRPFMRYYEGLLGSFPFPKVTNWAEATDLISQLGHDPVALNARQREVSEWWRLRKQSLRREVTEIINNHLFRGHEPAKLVRATRPVTKLPGWRYVELLRHHSSAAALRRLGIAAHRARGRVTRGLLA